MLLAAALILPLALSAVVVSPTAIFLGDRSRSTQLTLFNGTASPEELTMELRYGYPDVDSSGALIYRLIDSVGASDPSAAAWVNVYPRRLTLGPGARQTVRIVGTPPAGLPDREYWARLIIRSNPKEVLDMTGANPGVRAGLSLEMRTVIPVLYRKGLVSTSVAVQDFVASRVADSLVTHVAVHRGGNAAFLGHAQFDLRDGNGRRMGTWRIPVAIHVDQRRRFIFHLDPAARQAAGLTLTLTISPERSDLPAAQLLQAARITAVTPVSGS